MSSSICAISEDFMALIFERVSVSSMLDLPDDMVALILKGLPFSSLVQCRKVCKQLNSFITSSEFSSQFEKSSKVLPMLVGNGPVEGCSIQFHNPKLGSWVSLSLPFFHDDPQSGPLYLTASSGGLMCFETNDRRNFIICNPITKQRRHLQLPVADDDLSSRPCSCLNPTFCIHLKAKDFHEGVREPDMLTGLVVDEKAGSYKLIVASVAERLGRGTFIYDSLEGSWTKGAEVPCGKGFVNPVALTVEGSLYCLIENDPYDPYDSLGYYFTGRRVVSKYDVKHDRWFSSAPYALEPSGSRNLLYWRNELELVEHKGQVKLLARLVHRRSQYKPFYDFYKPSSFHGPVAVLTVFHRGNELAVDRSQWDWPREGPRDWSDVNVKAYLQNARVSNCHWYSKASAHSASCAGHGEDVYIMGKLAKNAEFDTYHVLKVNSTSTTLLPSFRREDCNEERQMELRVFQPSLSAGV